MVKKSKEAKNQSKLNDLLGNIVDRKFQYMNYGETVGIPQGNIISDLMSELLLAFIDYKLMRRIKKIENESEKSIVYKILRYRDDYRILTKNIEESMIINRELVILLQRFKLSLGKSKTSQVTDLISGELREVKQYWIEHDPVIKLTTDKLYELPQNFMKQSIDKQKTG
ncbi:RNA-directed DNA polymerase [Listeria aquatica]|uniref:RNA-directed DNA polymerase n=1 Tax=Listeria aquatica TaxID=1494960 RepID=UPI003F7211C9